MDNTHQPSTQQNAVLRASEINQYTYCSFSWYLQKRGYKPQSAQLEKGKKAHTHLGDTIDSIQNKQKKSTYLAILGYILLIIVGLLILLEVIV